MVQPTDDDILVNRAQNGDSQAVGLLYDRHQSHIFRFVWSRVGDRSLAEDLTSEVFTRMVAHLARYQPGRVPFRAWLYRIARNIVIDHGRRAGKRTLVNFDDAALQGGGEDDPMVQVAHRLTLERVQRALERIDAAQREVVELRFLVGLSLQEVAETLDKSLAAVKSLQHRGLRALNATLVATEIE